MRSITREWQRNKGSQYRTTISDQLSSTLNNLQHELEISDLYENMNSRKNVMRKAMPKTLVDTIGLEVLMQRLPEQVSHPTSSEQKHLRFLELLVSSSGIAADTV